MARPIREFCVDCDGHIDEVGELSSRYRCRGCAVVKFDANMEGLKTHRGPYFHRWRSRLLAAFGVPTDLGGGPDAG